MYLLIHVLIFVHLAINKTGPLFDSKTTQIITSLMDLQSGEIINILRVICDGIIEGEQRETNEKDM